MGLNPQYSAMRIRSDWRKRLEKAVAAAGGNRAAISKRSKLNVTYLRDILDRGQKPNPANAQKLSEGLGIDLSEWFVELDTTAITKQGDDEFFQIGRFDVSFSMGPGSLVGDHPEPIGHWLVESQYLRTLTRSGPDQLAIVKTAGDSMLPTLQPDDWVLIDRAQRRLSREGIYAIRVGEDVWIKRLSLNLRNKTIRVISDNSAIPVQDVDEDDLQIIGRVVCLIARKM